MHSRGVFVAPADVALDHLGQPIAKLVGQPLVGEIVECAITRPQRDIKRTDTPTQYAQKRGQVGPESNPVCRSSPAMAALAGRNLLAIEIEHEEANGRR